MRLAGALLLPAAILSMGCALVGYDFDDYRAGSGGASSSASGSASSSSGGPARCGGMPFKPAVPSAVSAVPLALHVVDLDLDGRPDVVVANKNPGNVSVILNVGGGAFGGELAGPASGIAPTAITSGKLDSNPPPYVVVADQGNKGVDLAHDLGKGQLDVIKKTQVCTVGPSDVVVTRVDTDPQFDLVVVCEMEGVVFLLRGDGSGGLVMASPQNLANVAGAAAIVALEDASAMSRPDLAVVSPTMNAVTILHFNALKTAYDAGLYPVPLPERAAAGDFNHDGKLGIALSSKSPAGSILLNLGNGSFMNIPGALKFGVPTHGIAVADFDHDGNADVAAAGDTEVVVLFGKGGGMFEAPVKLPGLSGGLALEAVDLDGDGFADLVEGSATVRSVAAFMNRCSPAQ